MSAEENESDKPAATASQTRRHFLQRLTIGSVAVSATSIAAAAAITAATPSVANASLRHPDSVKVFRFRTRNNVSCRACQIHHRYTMFHSRKVARSNRAHPGCDCAIVPQWIKRSTFRRLFKATGAIETGVVDLRKV